MIRERRFECQACGNDGPVMDAVMQQRVAANPYNFIWHCPDCIRQGFHIERGYD